MKAKRIFAMLLALCLVVSLVPASALPVFAAEQGKIETSFVNPLYEGVLDVENISEPEIRPTQIVSNNLGEYDDESLVADSLRKKMMERNQSITVKVRTKKDPDTVAASLFERALYDGSEGAPDDGDYLRWNIASIDDVSGEYFTSGGYYFVDITYEFTYLTTASQEDALDTAIENLLDELDLYEASTYSKLKGVYDYICQNVVYDEEHAEDPDYLLMHSAYAALVNKAASPQGYALLLYRLVSELGLSIRIIAGYEPDSGAAHIWNIAKINGKYHNMDATMDALLSEGTDNYYFFLVSNSNYLGFTRYEEYSTADFTSNYPMASENYDPFPVGQLGDNITWSFNAVTCVLELSGTGDMPSGNTPWKAYGEDIRKVVFGEGITSVASCFSTSNNPNLETVVFSSTIKRINDYAFRSCKKLKTVYFSEGLESIGWLAFEGCYLLTDVVLPDGLLTIGDSAFKDCLSLKSIIIPDSVTTLEKWAFYSCSNLESIEFPDGITVVPDSVCAHNAKLTSVVLPAEVVEIDRCAFSGCSITGTLELPDSLEIIRYSAFSNAFGDSDFVGDLVIPRNVRIIEEKAFAGNSLSNVYFEGHAPEIGYAAFRDQVINAYYPQQSDTWTEEVRQQYGGTVTWIPYDCPIPVTGTWGDNLTWELLNGVLTISGEGEMLGTDELRSEGFPWYAYKEDIKEVVVESGVTTVAWFAFAGYTNLEKVVLEESVTTLGRHAFSRCKNLKDIQLPSTLKTIDADCFLMSGIANVTLPEGLETIGAEAFMFTNLTGIVIPDTVTSVGTSAFGNCEKLTSAVLSAGCESLPMNMFFNCPALETVTIPEGVTAIGWSVFSDCGALKNVTLPESLVSIGVDAFKNCTSLTEMEIPAGVTTFENPFRGCTSLSSITFLGDAPVPEGQTAFLDNNGFEGVTATIYYPANNETWTEDVMQQYGGTLTWVAYQSGVCGDELTWTLKDGVLTISGTGEMYDMTDDIHAANSWHPYSDQVKKVIIEDGATSIGVWAFRLHANLEEVVIPETVTAIGEAAFGWCTSLKRLEIPAGVTKLDSFVAHGCQSLTELILPEGLVTIERDAFAKCTSLTKVVFPSTLDVISISGFAGCTSLSEIWFTGHAPRHLTMAFEGVTATAYYPWILSTWTEEKIASYETPETVTWMPYDLELDNPFTDVPENKYFYTPVLWAYYNGITSGKTATTFEPNATCTRAQVMTFLWAAAGRPEPSSLENPFTDVSESAYYYKAVLWAVEKGITSGTSATTFSPNASCTRNQVVTFLWVNAGRPEPTIENPFTDVEEGKYYYKPILWAYENGITTGKTPTTFEPHSPCTRGQIMTFLYQALAEK